MLPKAVRVDIDDWIRIIQSAESKDRRALFTCHHDHFLTLARIHGMTIIEELNVPDSEKTILPIQGEQGIE